MKRIFHKDSGEEHNFWMSYTDLMSGFLIVFIILSAVMFKHYNAAKKEYDSLITSLDGKDIKDIKDQMAKMIHLIDSLNGANLKNLIFEYKDVFTSNQDINVEFNSLRGSIVLTHQSMNHFLFASGEPDFEPELRKYLDAIRIPLVVRTMKLWNERDYKNVELRIEGHTDPNGISSIRSSNKSFLENLNLSSERANKVYEYILNNSELNGEQKEFVKKNMISVGYSFSRRVAEGSVDDVGEDASSRRIEFRIISK